jgi:hypothetical protein
MHGREKPETTIKAGPSSGNDQGRLRDHIAKRASEISARGSVVFLVGTGGESLSQNAFGIMGTLREASVGCGC